ncbi:RGCVC family protein [Jatrophihabitans sp.]|uniref:RGCVC family protein n=1 Tax=Jatrophihabitans sp. TaxID=1932789 RepID=UPI0038CDA196
MQKSQTVAESRTEHDDLLCVACGHPREIHDSIAVRYCAATGASGAVRGCLCSPSAVHTGMRPLRTTQPFR